MRGKQVLRQFPFVFLATAAVAVLPAIAVAALPGSLSPWVAAPLCVGLALAFARAGALLWRRSPRSRDVLFADLMLWGWARRLQTERRLKRVEGLVTGTPGPVDAILHVRALERVTTMLEARDVYTRHHSLRVTRHSEGIARELGLAEDEVARIRTAAALHDVGKYFTPREILNKPGRLTDEEFAVIKLHPGAGADMLAGVVEPEIEAMIRHHHERLGGSGYPDGLVGDEIPLGARIIAVADTFDAMTSTRAYRTARPHQKALLVLREEAGVALDAAAVDAFARYYSGRRGVAWWSAGSGMTQAVVPLRELIVPAAVALPLLGAGAVLTEPQAAAPPAAAKAARPAPTPIAASRTRAVARAATAPARRSVARRRNARVRERSRPRMGAPVAIGHRPRPGVEPAATATPGAGPATGGDGGSGAPAAPAVPPAPAPTTAPEPEAPAPTSAPEVVTPPVTVDETPVVPAIEVDLPDLPVDLPEIELPDLVPPKG